MWGGEVGAVEREKDPFFKPPRKKTFGQRKNGKQRPVHDSGAEGKREGGEAGEDGTTRVWGRAPQSWGN